MSLIPDHYHTYMTAQARGLIQRAKVVLWVQTSSLGEEKFEDTKKVKSEAVIRRTDNTKIKAKSKNFFF